jgi:hypothetical protein
MEVDNERKMAQQKNNETEEYIPRIIHKELIMPSVLIINKNSVVGEIQDKVGKSRYFLMLGKSCRTFSKRILIGYILFKPGIWWCKEAKLIKKTSPSNRTNMNHRP